MADLARANITFGIRCDTLDPQRVTNHLGLMPAHAFRRGDHYDSASGPQVRPFGVWQLRSEGFVDSLDLEQHASHILTLLEPIQEQIKSYLLDPECYVDIRIWWEFPSETGGYCLPSNTIERLSRLCKEFNFVYIAICNDK